MRRVRPAGENKVGECVRSLDDMEEKERAWVGREQLVVIINVYVQRKVSIVFKDNRWHA